jgi:hypothetical protein
VRTPSLFNTFYCAFNLSSLILCCVLKRALGFCVWLSDWTISVSVCPRSYEHHHASPRPFYAALTLPVSLFILSCRQLAAFYAKQWTFGYRSDSRRGSMADGQPPRESQPESEAGTLEYVEILALWIEMRLCLNMQSSACRGFMSLHA